MTTNWRAVIFYFFVCVLCFSSILETISSVEVVNQTEKQFTGAIYSGITGISCVIFSILANIQWELQHKIITLFIFSDFFSIVVGIVGAVLTSQEFNKLNTLSSCGYYGNTGTLCTSDMKDSICVGDANSYFYTSLCMRNEIQSENTCYCSYQNKEISGYDCSKYKRIHSCMDLLYSTPQQLSLCCTFAISIAVSSACLFCVFHPKVFYLPSEIIFENQNQNTQNLDRVLIGDSDIEVSPQVYVVAENVSLSGIKKADASYVETFLVNEVEINQT
jgi:hypothetical protein